jgi:hypothetical protein
LLPAPGGRRRTPPVLRAAAVGWKRYEFHLTA